MHDNINIDTAYKAMVKFVEAYWERTGRPEEIGNLLSDISLDTFSDDGSADPAMLEDWYKSVKSVLNSIE